MAKEPAKAPAPADNATKGKPADAQGKGKPADAQGKGKPGDAAKGKNAAAADAQKIAADAKQAEEEKTEQTEPEEIKEIPLTEEEKEKRSRYFNAITNVIFFCLLGLLGILGISAVFMLDFLDLISIRHKIPEEYRKYPPLVWYYDFVKLNQLPTEERLQEIIKREQKKYNDLIVSGSSDLQKRSQELENAYKELIRSQEEKYKKRHQELLAMQEDILKEKKRLEELKADLEMRKGTIDVLSRNLASEAMNIESSLAKLMQEESRLKPIQDMASSMNPKDMATIFDEVSDNMLIYRILKGIAPDRSSYILSNMDPEKAGKIIKISQSPPTLPPPDDPGQGIPSSLRNLVASAQANLR
ncbi:MAG: hypothetical protein HQM10_22080 [Candidatus Riflebacteria bacterium]|nr:hypothetical protein [Candidatus Riflebacteria bacterium]